MILFPVYLSNPQANIVAIEKMNRFSRPSGKLTSPDEWEEPELRVKELLPVSIGVSQLVSPGSRLFSTLQHLLRVFSHCNDALVLAQL